MLIVVAFSWSLSRPTHCLLIGKTARDALPPAASASILLAGAFHLPRSWRFMSTKDHHGRQAGVRHSSHAVCFLIRIALSASAAMLRALVEKLYRKGDSKLSANCSPKVDQQSPEARLPNSNAYHVDHTQGHEVSIRSPSLTESCKLVLSCIGQRGPVRGSWDAQALFDNLPSLLGGMALRGVFSSSQLGCYDADRTKGVEFGRKPNFPSLPYCFPKKSRSFKISQALKILCPACIIR